MFLERRIVLFIWFCFVAFEGQKNSLGGWTKWYEHVVEFGANKAVEYHPDWGSIIKFQRFDFPNHVNLLFGYLVFQNGVQSSVWDPIYGQGCF